ncbi:hypothetical protein QNM99_20370 [Pseudomonas sp. PCH446]
MNARLLKVMSEKQIYRIDHYLGKETVQNILVSRFSSGLFEAFWNNHYIDHVQITAAETVGVETRGSFYEHTAPCGTWCPITCSIVAMVAMEPPAAFGADAVRGEKAKWSARSVPGRSRRPGQFGARPVPGRRTGWQGRAGYREESNVAPDSNTETMSRSRS